MFFKTATTTTPAPDGSLYFKAIKREIDAINSLDEKIKKCNEYLDGVLSGYYPDVRPDAANVIRRLELYRGGLSQNKNIPINIVNSLGSTQNELNCDKTKKNELRFWLNNEYPDKSKNEKAEILKNHAPQFDAKTIGEIVGLAEGSIYNRRKVRKCEKK